MHPQLGDAAPVLEPNETVPFPFRDLDHVAGAVIVNAAHHAIGFAARGAGAEANQVGVIIFIFFGVGQRFARPNNYKRRTIPKLTSIFGGF